MPPPRILFERESGEGDFAPSGEAGSDIAYALASRAGGKGDGAPLIAATLNSGGNSGGFRTEPGEHLVSAPTDSDGVRDATGVSEGMDAYLLLPEGKDSPRYRALGNAVTVQVAEWIARRIADFDNRKIT